jgi:aryl-phospho-beta-D-glucosidase BglC (GH1 family)
VNNLDNTIITQYSNSPHINAVIEKCNEVIDPSQNIDDFYNLIWNVATAEGYGLDVWGRIVGVNRVLELPDGIYFGFAEATILSADPFNQAPFYSGEQLTTNYSLTDEAYRQLIYAKALANISDGSIKSFNQILRLLFPGRGNAYVADGLDMTMTYTFDFLLTEVEATIVVQSGVLPRPAGVAIFFVENGVGIGDENTPLFSITGGTLQLGVTADPVDVTVMPGGVTITTASNPPPPVTTGVTYLTAGTSGVFGQGNVLFDVSGTSYVPRTADWYGMESQVLQPDGLDQRGYKTITVGGVVHLGILDQIKAAGFNGIRFGVCQDITWNSTTMSPSGWTPSNGVRPTSGYIDPDLNPDFFISTDYNSTTGAPYSTPQPLISSLEMLDKIINYAGSIGLRVILDMHCLAPSANDNTGNSRTSPIGTRDDGYNLDPYGPPGATDGSGNPVQGSGQPNWVVTKLWYTTVNRTDAGMNTGQSCEYRNEAQAVAAWVAFATRYAGNPAMAGCDIINEPAGGSWETNRTLSAANLATSLPEYYERVGEAIHAVNPDVLIICEGPSSWRPNMFNNYPGPAADGSNPSVIAANDWLSANGGQIINAAGASFTPKGTHWWGMEQNLLPTLLNSNSDTDPGRAYKTITTNALTGSTGTQTVHEGVLDEIKRLGFNVLRLSVCEDLTWTNAAVRVDGSVAINGYLNPDLLDGTQSLYTYRQNFIPAIQILDKIVAHCAAIGLRVVIDMHQLCPSGNSGDTGTGPAAGSTIGATGDKRSEAQWIAAHVFLANRYASNAAVCGLDLLNEPYASTWDNDSHTGWPAAVERCAAQIQAVNPHVLIIAEGVAGNITYNGATVGTVWGSNLTGFTARPIVLPTANKLVVSPHEYGYAAGSTQAFLTASNFPHNLPAWWENLWGHLVTSGTVPVWVGEFSADFRASGVAPSSTVDSQWFAQFEAYLISKFIGWSLFSIVPSDPPVSGLLEASDRLTPDPVVMNALTSLLAESVNPTNGSNDVQQYPGFSSALMNVATRPVMLTIPGKVVYSPHEYGSVGYEGINSLSPANQAAWNLTGGKGLSHFYEYDPTFPANMSKTIWEDEWGFIASLGIAPLWIGETGADFTCDISNNAGWGVSGSSGSTVQVPLRTDSAPTADSVCTWQTVDGTGAQEAVSGVAFTAASGTFTWPANQLVVYVPVTLLTGAMAQTLFGITYTVAGQTYTNVGQYIITAPVNLANDTLWMNELNNYMRAKSIGFNWFAVNPDGPNAPLGLFPNTANGWGTEVNPWQQERVTMLTAS